MKPLYAHAATALALTFALAACVPKPRPVPPVETRPAPVATSAPEPPPPANWQDAAQTPGEWRYSQTANGSLASFGLSPAQSEFALRCMVGERRLLLTRYGNTMSTMTVRAETATRTLATMPTGNERAGIVAALPAGDRLFDAMALSKGRFAIEARGTPILYLPAWAEVTRVIEDCR